MGLWNDIFGSVDDRSSSDHGSDIWSDGVWTYDPDSNYSHNHDEDWGHSGPPDGYDED